MIGQLIKSYVQTRFDESWVIYEEISFTITAPVYLSSLVVYFNSLCDAAVDEGHL